MKLFRLTIGMTDVFAVGESQEDMEARKAEVDHTFAYLPVHIEEVVIPGYQIIVQPDEEQSAPKSRRKAGES